ncbi:hypothetical protein [Marivita sp.]|uniref:hypothetical protein n=1 Tax=Marivita sp. TaxID=2003365 RepID=UPI00321BF2F3
MADNNVLNPHPPEFDRFLHACVGKDRNGHAVTLLSALARLGLDPWKETAELVTMGHDEAQVRLEALLAQFRDVPALASKHGKIARDLSQLLPEEPASGSLKRVTSTVADEHLGKSGAIWVVLAIIFLLFQMFMVGGSGSGE